MEELSYKEAGEFISDNLRLRTLPLGVKFMKDISFPEKTRRPKEGLRKKITICQGVSMARLYGWTMGLCKEDIVCVPAMISFGFTGASNQKETIGKLFCDVTLSRDIKAGAREAGSMNLIPSGDIRAIVIAPLATWPDLIPTL